jgi:hypothetical protein
MARRTWTEEERRQAECLHRCRRLGPEARPYRYHCVVCGKRMKLLSGVDLDGLERGPA